MCVRGFHDIKIMAWISGRRNIHTHGRARWRFLVRMNPWESDSQSDWRSSVKRNFRHLSSRESSTDENVYLAWQLSMAVYCFSSFLSESSDFCSLLELPLSPPRSDAIWNRSTQVIMAVWTCWFWKNLFCLSNYASNLTRVAMSC